MKNVIGLEKYREYQKQIYELKKRVAKNRSENDETSIKDEIRNDQNKKMIDTSFLVSFLVVSIAVGAVTSFLNIMNKMELAWIDAIIYGVWGILFIVLYTINKRNKRKILRKKLEIISKEDDVIREYEQKEAELYGIIIYVVTLNDFYHELVCINEEKIEETWQKLTQRVIEAINDEIDYDICIQKYQNFFDEWLRKKEIYA